MTYDFTSSVAPEKGRLNSEGHFLSTTQYRDLEMTAEYVESTIWLGTVLGMDANLHWYWSRNPDGSLDEHMTQVGHESGLSNAFPGSVSSQPRVVNAVSQTMMDLNAYSDIFLNFQEAEKPMRVFYSETSVLNKHDHMEKVFKLMEISILMVCLLGLPQKIS
ncbi:MAG: hypothetical protein R3Y63_07180 [Eubacteriales bacterium]